MTQTSPVSVVFALMLVLMLGFSAGAVFWKVYKQRKTWLSAPLTSAHSRLLKGFIFYGLLPLTYGLCIGVRQCVVAFAPRQPSLVQVLSITAVGPLCAFSIAVGIWVWVLRNPQRAAYNFICFEWGRQIFLAVLWLLPLTGLIFQVGDMQWMRRSLNAHLNFLGDSAAAMWVVVGSIFIFAFRKSALRKRLQYLKHPLYDDKNLLVGLLAEAPDRVSTLIELGKVALALEQPDEAHQRLTRAEQIEPNNPMVHFLLGVAQMKMNRAHEACESLERAGYLATDPAHRHDESMIHEITLALSAAQLMLGNAVRAAEVAKAAHEERPRDPRGMFLQVDALVALGKIRDAKTQLEEAFAKAEGQLAYDIRLKLETLSKRREQHA